AKDRLIGLKENVIIGKLIPAGTGAPAAIAARREEERRRAAEALAGGELPEGFGEEYNPLLEEARSTLGEGEGGFNPLVAEAEQLAEPAEGEEPNPFLTGLAPAEDGKGEEETDPLAEAYKAVEEDERLEADAALDPGKD
ncbi:MAG: hypothetical protein ACRDGL_03125, partial [Candidatus Limnocylindrales bacterium]